MEQFNVVGVENIKKRNFRVHVSRSRFQKLPLADLRGSSGYISGGLIETGADRVQFVHLRSELRA